MADTMMIIMMGLCIISLQIYICLYITTLTALVNTQAHTVYVFVDMDLDLDRI